MFFSGITTKTGHYLKCTFNKTPKKGHNTEGASFVFHRKIKLHRTITVIVFLIVQIEQNALRVDILSHQEKSRLSVQ
jgi:hypothetical protein